MTTDQPEPMQTVTLAGLTEGVRYVPATEATAKLLVDHLAAAASATKRGPGVTFIEIHLGAAEDAIRKALGIEAKQS